MDFLESAAILIPVLTGIPVTIYSKDYSVLVQFERQFCFSPVQQRLYTAPELERFLTDGAGDVIYDILEPLGSRLIVLRAGEKWALLGPYVEEAWNGGAARRLLARAGASENAVMPYKTYRCKLAVCRRDHILSTVRLVAGQVEGGAVREVKTICAHAGGGDLLSYPSDYGDSAVVNRRYAIEDQLFLAVSRGDREAAVRALGDTREVSADLRFISDDFQDHLAAAASLRTLVRLAAKQAGLSPVLIDSISQEYAQKMQHAASGGEVDDLILRVVEHFCAEIRKHRSASCSICVRLAMDYMEANLSRQLTVAEIARAAGTDRHQLTKTFRRETGMTLKQYLAKRRCEIAAELLPGGGVSVQEVAAYVGYPDSNYFSKVFKANQGISPQACQRTRWRAGHKEKPS